MFTWRVILLALALDHWLEPTPCYPAGPMSQAVREVVEGLLRRSEAEALEATRATLAKRLQSLAGRHGDEVLAAISRGGPNALKAIEEAGSQGGKVAQLFLNHGDEAAWLVQSPARMNLVLKHGDEAANALLRHRQIAEPIVKEFGPGGARALASLDGQNGRRLAMLLEDGTIKQTGQVDAILKVVGRHGDEAMAFIWRNKGALLVGAGLSAFLLNPEPFLSGARDLAEVSAHAATQPLVEGVRELVRQINWTWVVAVLVGLIGSWYLWRWCTKKN